MLIPYVLVEACGYAPTQAGAALLPLPLVLAVASPFLGGLAGHIGARAPLTVGPLIVAIEFLIALRIGPGASYWTGAMPAIFVIAFGLSFAVAPLIIGAVDPHHTGSASGLNSAVARSGGLVATALLGSVLASLGGQLVTAFHDAMIGGFVTRVMASLRAFWLVAPGTSNAT